MACLFTTTELYRNSAQYQYVGFSRRNSTSQCIRLKTTRRCCDARTIRIVSRRIIKFRVAVHTLWEKVIRFRHPDYNPDRAQKLISYPCPDICRHATFHPNPCTPFLSNLAHRQTYRQTNAGVEAKT